LESERPRGPRRALCRGPRRRLRPLHRDARPDSDRARAPAAREGPMIGSTRTIGTFVWNTLRGQHALLLTVVAAICLSLFFVPRGAALGRLNLELGFTHKAIAILEEKYGAGDFSAATIGALAQARAQVGDVAGAVFLLEQLLSEHPRDPELLQAL